MIRISDTESMGQNEYSTERAFRAAGTRPDLAPSDTIPMGIKTSWVNPGEQILMDEGEILPLTPLGPEATNVFPGVYPAPVNTQNLDYEDRIPRIQERGDQVLRSRSGVRGPAQYWKYGGVQGLGQASEDPVLFYNDPSEVAYQTYPGAFLGQSRMERDRINAKAMFNYTLTTAAGAALALLGAPAIKNGNLKQTAVIIGAVVSGIGLAGFLAILGNKAGSALWD